jgi:hypothetical protein
MLLKPIKVILLNSIQMPYRSNLRPALLLPNYERPIRQNLSEILEMWVIYGNKFVRGKGLTVNPCIT